MVGLLPVNMRARLLPNDSAWLLLPCAWRIMKSSSAPKMSSGRNSRSARDPVTPLTRRGSLYIHIDSRTSGLPVVDAVMPGTR